MSSSLHLMKSFLYLIWMFEGREATKKIAEILPYSKCKLLTCGAKVNEALTSGMAGAIASAIFETKSHRPDNIVNVTIQTEAIHEEEHCSLPYLINSRSQ